MGKKICLVLAAVLMAAPALAPAVQEKPSPTFKIKVTAEQANIRDTPDIGSPVVQLIPEGTVLEAEKKDGEWYLVLFTRDSGLQGRGYIHESLVQPLEAVPFRQVEPTTTKPAPKAQEPPREAPVVRMPAEKNESMLLTETRLFAIALTTGGNYAAVGDLNTAAKGFADYYSAATDADGRGSVGGVHLSPVLGLEISYAVMPRIRLLLGLDYFGGRRTSQVEFGAVSGQEIVRTGPRVQALPVSLGVAYYPRPFVYVKGSLQYYFAKCNYLYRYEKDLYWQEWQGDAKARGVGAAAGVGGEWEFYPGIFLVGEAELRFARFGGFTGKDISINSEGNSYSEQGTLYSFSSRVPGKGDFPLVFIRSALPAEANVSEAREARINFNGGSLKVGIRIRF